MSNKATDKSDRLVVDGIRPVGRSKTLPARHVTFDDERNGSRAGNQTSRLDTAAHAARDVGTGSEPLQRKIEGSLQQAIDAEPPPRNFSKDEILIRRPSRSPSGRGSTDSFGASRDDYPPGPWFSGPSGRGHIFQWSQAEPGNYVDPFDMTPIYNYPPPPPAGPGFAPPGPPAPGLAAPPVPAQSGFEARETGVSYKMEEPLGNSGQGQQHAFLHGDVSATHFLNVNEEQSVGEESLPISAAKCEDVDGATSYRLVKAVYKHDAESQMDSAILHAAKSSDGKPWDEIPRWIHIQQNQLDFESYAELILKLCGSDERLKESVEPFLRQIKSAKEESVRSGRGHRFLKPFSRFMKHTDPATNRTILTLFAACFPFPVLEVHQPKSGKAQTAPTTHSMLTLFQSKNGRSDHQLDRHQAICERLAKTDGRVLHVGQLWSFVINNELIVTCSTLSESELRGEILTMAPPGSTTRSGNLQVVGPNGKLWLLNSSDCSTWLDFTSHFAALAPQFSDSFQVKLGDEVVDNQNWHTVVESAAQGTARLKIDFKRWRAPRPSDNDLQSMVKSLNEFIDEDAGKERPEENATKSHPGQNPAPPGISREDFSRRLQQWTLSQDPPVSSASSSSSSSSSDQDDDSSAIKPKSNHRIGLALLELVKQVVDVGRPGPFSDTEGRLFTVVADFFDNPTCSLVREETSPIPNLIAIKLDSLFATALKLAENGCGRKVFREKGIGEPLALEGLMENTMTMFETAREYLQQEDGVSDGFDGHEVASLADQLYHVYRALLSKMDNDIAKCETVAPDGLAALMISRLVHMSVLGEDDVMDIYSDHIERLDMKSRLGEPSLEPLAQLRYFKYELAAYHALQEQQMKVIGKMVDGLFGYETQKQPNPHAVFRTFASTNRRGGLHYDGTLRALFGCARTLMERDTLLRSWEMELDFIRNECRARLEEVQDWRENATVLFAVVTVIFLPLSFAASVFGMNTADVRDMRLNQWAFWASAIPFTLLVMMLALYWVDVPPLRRWWNARRGRRER